MPIDKRDAYRQEQKQTNTGNVVFRGGANTYLEPEQLPFGKYSDAQNVRNTHPGMIKRPGQQRLNSTAEGSVIATMFQFSKGKKTERHFYAQCGANILEATTVPPGSITGSFGSVVFTQSASPKPAAWTVITDKMLFSNGVDGHQIYTGIGTPVEKFIVYKAATAHSDIPDSGSDYSIEVSDDSTTTVATLDGLGTYYGGLGTYYVGDPALYIKFDGADGSQAYTAETGQTVTFVNTAQLDTAYKQFGPASLLLDGDSDSVAVPDSDDWFLSDGKFTIRGFFRPTGASGTHQAIVGQYVDANNYWWLECYNNLLRLVAFIGGTYTGHFLITCPFTPDGSSFYHIEIARNGTSESDWKFFINGVSQPLTLAFGGWDGTITNLAAPLRIGYYETGVEYFKGHIDELEIYKGTCLHTSNFTVQAYDYDAIYIMTPVPAKAFNVVMGNKNSTGASLSMNYWNGSWTSITSVVNGTSAAASCAFGADGSIAWSPPSDEITKNIYGANGFWYQLYLVGGGLSGVCDIATMTYDASFQPLQNVWDGVPINLVEAQVFTSNIAGAASFYQTQSPDAVVISSLLPDQKIYLATTDPLEAIYVDMGALTNSHIASIDTVGIFCGSTWSVASNIYDYTSGFVKSGWITFKRHTSVQPVQFGQLLNYAYWYYLQMSGSTTSSNLVVGFTGQPFFSITDLGDGLVNSGWRNRACYVFENTPNFVTVSEAYQPLHLNGSDSAVLRAGDGRTNRIVCMKNFYNEMMVWQEEKGVDGGTLTLFEGYTPNNFGSTLLSNRVGTFSPKSAVVVDGVITSTATDEQIKTIAYFLSHYGIFATDGRVVYSISDDIMDYFNPTKSTCIRNGYEDKMWIGYDSAYNVLRVGLVSGASATACNVFPVYDLVDRTWTFDSLGQALNSYVEVEAGSGNVPFIQVGGGTDGYAYRLNTSQDDVSTAIDAYVRMELNLNGNEFMVKDIKLRHKTQTAGNISIVPYQNGVEKASFTVPMTAERSGETIRRVKTTVDILGTNVAFKIGNASLSNDMTLFDIGFNLEVFDER